MYLLVLLFASAVAAPHYYSQTQTGDLNVRADFENIVFLIAIPQRTSLSLDLLEDLMLKKNKGSDNQLQNRADVQVMEAFVEPNTPYKVEIGTDKKSFGGDSRAVEVVISGRRRLDADALADERDELKLLGATEQCGPGRERDPDTLGCRASAVTESNESLQSELDEKNEKINSEPVPEVVST
ncbi:uncharacterized protein LOC114248871 [Bombyx mandarina]|uniref:Uncharacterized protein LOC114248871 n=1 Tax=Bombyx mandarina TaxID=7092 RepID=A0A6J2K753_BOMMA|nr:uncharacterized protein LOC114248871 [Bombyx mandarina]